MEARPLRPRAAHVSDRDTPPPAAPGTLEERSGYQGTHDPGQPTGLMQQQTQPAAPQPGPNADSGAHAGTNTGASGNHQSSGTNR
jgi:hypothetical protein